MKRILIANRGEIAVRIIKTCRKMGIFSIAVYSKADEDALHVEMADEAFLLDGSELSETYLNISKIVDIAKKSKCDAIHPGYGFLAENPAFVKSCVDAGIIFIGPRTEAIHLMGNKVESRNFVAKLGVPMTKGASGSLEYIIEEAKNIPLPILVKAAAGGGGKGMRLVHKLEDLKETIEATSREAKAYFGDSEVFIEQFIVEPRHIEIQVLGDKHGNVVHLYERECSIQRRYQKIIEESPSPTLTQEVREKMGAAAVTISKAIQYDNAGTLEFLVDKNLNFYFLEMNTRIQVEHPVTEMVTGIDIVKEQILIAEGKALSFSQKDISQNGHAIEARIYAEDPEQDFRPSPGMMTLYHQASADSIRIDSGIEKASMVHSFYDPMISKVIAYGANREEATLKLINALEHFIVHGIKTNNSYLIEMLRTNEFVKNNISTKFCDLKTSEIIQSIHNSRNAISQELVMAGALAFDLNQKTNSSIWNSIGYWRNISEIKIRFEEKLAHAELKISSLGNFIFTINAQVFSVTIKESNAHFLRVIINGESHIFYVSTSIDGSYCVRFNGFDFTFLRMDILIEKDVFIPDEDLAGGNSIFSPMPGKVIKINVKEGDEVKKGQTLLIVEAMKMENNVLATRDAVIERIKVKVGEMVDSSKTLIEFLDTEE
jgi:3-methylcrotonyl-CoA carboxylase alpha subunit